MNKIWKWCRRSLTILWARLMVVVSVISGVLVNYGSDPHVNDLLSAYLTPRNVSIALAVIGILTEIARRRTAKKVDD